MLLNLVYSNASDDGWEDAVLFAFSARHNSSETNASQKYGFYFRLFGEDKIIRDAPKLKTR